jgi:glutamyl-tRNA reductase
MIISVVGINHRTAPVALREKVAIRVGKLQDSLAALQSYLDCGVILSTCNRTEIYTGIDAHSHAVKQSLTFLKTCLDMTDAVSRQYTYVLENEAAVNHLYRIACGLESMVVGEYEVLGQVRQALEAAEVAKMVSLPLRRLFQGAIRTGRRVREETDISKSALSVSSVAVDLAVRLIGSLDGCKTLIIGAGEAGRLVAEAAKKKGLSKVTVASRTLSRAAALASVVGGTPISMSSLASELENSNLVVACADAPHRVLDVPQVESVMRKRSNIPLVIIDIGVPRNVSPSVAQIDNVFLYNIDDLKQVAEQNQKRRKLEVKKAEEIIAAEVSRFLTWWQTFKVRPVVSALMKKAENVRRAQLNKTLKRLSPLSDEELYSLEMMTKSIVTNILKEPIQFLKTNADDNGSYKKMVEELFALDVEDASKGE